MVTDIYLVNVSSLAAINQQLAVGPLGGVVLVVVLVMVLVVVLVLEGAGWGSRGKRWRRDYAVLCCFRYLLRQPTCYWLAHQD